MIEIDGSLGEGGGQVVRSALSLSLATGRAMRIVNIRANRQPMGLKRQHVTAVEAAAAVGGATVRGADVGSSELTFRPGPVRAGRYRFDVGTAGSTTLVLQTILPVLATTDGPSVVELIGGTHNPFAPPFEFLEQTFLPLFGRMGAEVRLTLRRRGFYPRGGGQWRAAIRPTPALARLELTERGPVRRIRGTVIVARLPRHIAERELRVVADRLPIDETDWQIIDDPHTLSPGNVLLVAIETEGVTEVISALGQRGVPAEQIAAGAVAEAEAYFESPAAVGPHLADQLLLPLALGRGGRFTTPTPPTLHTTTHAEVIHLFLGRGTHFTDRDDGTTLVEVESAE